MIYAGGTISLTDNVSSILVAPGAVLNVSGTSGTFEIPQLIAGGPLGGNQVILMPQAEWSNGGDVNIEAVTGLLLEGTLIGQGGARQASGGTLTLATDSTPATAAGINTFLILVPDVAQALEAAQTLNHLSTSFNFATYVPTIQAPTGADQEINPQVPAGAILFGADSLNNSGFANLTMTGALGYTGPVALNSAARSSSTAA